MSGEIVGISGSPGINSRSRIIVAELVHRLVQRTRLSSQFIDLNDLAADALLGRRPDAYVEESITVVRHARIVVVGTPVYRASYAGQLKAFFDLFPQSALRGVTVGLVATGAGSAHALVVDHALRPLVASLAGLSAASGMYVTDGQFPDKSNIPVDVIEKIDELGHELIILAQRKDVA